jgi:hypothetical protein
MVEVKPGAAHCALKFAGITEEYGPEDQARLAERLVCDSGWWDLDGGVNGGLACDAGATSFW